MLTLMENEIQTTRTHSELTRTFHFMRYSFMLCHQCSLKPKYIAGL